MTSSRLRTSLDRCGRWGIPVGAVLAVASLVDGPSPFALLQAAGGVIGVVLALSAVAALVGRRLGRAVLAALSAAVLITPLVHVERHARPAGTSLTVVAINTYVGEVDARAVVREVTDRHADVLVLPEMTADMWSKLQAAGLPAQLPHITGRTSGGPGMIVATRAPASCVELPAGMTCGQVDVTPGVEEPDTFTQITLRLPDGTLVHGTHLWTPRMLPVGRWREQQRQMQAWVEAHRGEAFVAAGDFNAGPAQPAFRAYANTLDRSPRDLPWTRTWPAWALGGVTQIDHVLANRWHATDSGTIVAPGGDHRGVWARLTR